MLKKPQIVRICHSRESGNPCFHWILWIPAFQGVAEYEKIRTITQFVGAHGYAPLQIVCFFSGFCNLQHPGKRVSRKPPEIMGSRCVGMTNPATLRLFQHPAKIAEMIRRANGCCRRQALATRCRGGDSLFQSRARLLPSSRRVETLDTVETT